MSYKDPEKRRAYMRWWRTTVGYEKNKAQKKREWSKLRAEILSSYGGRCVCCGESEPIFLSLDHIGGGGTKHRKTAGPHSVYLEVKANGFPQDRYRLLCYNCNIGVHRGAGLCPHQVQAIVERGAA